jgi:hypothetical protein
VLEPAAAPKRLAPSAAPTVAGDESESPPSKKASTPRVAAAAPPPKADPETDLGDSPAARPAKPTVDEEALQQALAQASQRAKGCHVAGGPTGNVRVSVSIAPSGDATGATVQGALFSNTVEGECIAAKFRALHIPPFTGNDVMVRKTVTID